MVFYESAKCLHGRMKQLKGKYYGSLFLHYQPVDKSMWNYTTDVSNKNHHKSNKLVLFCHLLCFSITIADFFLKMTFSLL